MEVVLLGLSFRCGRQTILPKPVFSSQIVGRLLIQTIQQKKILHRLIRNSSGLFRKEYISPYPSDLEIRDNSRLQRQLDIVLLCEVGGPDISRDEYPSYDLF